MNGSRASPQDILPKARKLAQMVADLRQGKHFPVTRLTSLKSLCQEPTVASRFVTFLARKTLQRVEQGKGHTRRRTKKAQAHVPLMTEAITAMEKWLASPTEARHEQLLDLLYRMREEQNEYKQISWGAVRLVDDWDLLLVEYAVQCLLRPYESPHWAYQTARHYAERYNSRYPEGLIPQSAPLVQDIAEFWAREAGTDLETMVASVSQEKKTSRMAPNPPPSDKRSSGHRGATKRKQRFTPRQGQFLAFIHQYWKLHRRAPAELDVVQYFRITPPSVHSMIVKLHELGLITREPGKARSIRVAIPEDQIPPLQGEEGPAW